MSTEPALPELPRPSLIDGAAFKSQARSGGTDYFTREQMLRLRQEAVAYGRMVERASILKRLAEGSAG